MRAGWLLLLTGCTAATAAPPTAGSAVGGDANVVTLKPLKMAGPFKTLHDSCASVPACGVELGVPGGNKPDCSRVEDPSREVNGRDISNPETQTERDHTAGDVELLVAGVDCGRPDDPHGDDSNYYMFIKRADGWWRSSALFYFAYNGKYCDGLMHVRWNDQPARTFAGIAGEVSCISCGKQGYEEDTTELMVRVEASGAKPIVFPPLVVGMRASSRRTEWSSDPTCPTANKYLSMTETWPAVDELVLSGPATWNRPQILNGVVEMGGGLPGKSSAGRYRFTR